MLDSKDGASLPSGLHTAWTERRHVMDRDGLDRDGKRPQHLPMLTGVLQSPRMGASQSAQPSSQLDAGHSVLLAAGLVYFQHQEMDQFPPIPHTSVKTPEVFYGKVKRGLGGERESLFMAGPTQRL